ncbi:hypothetical protein Tco_0229412, partial [Tanacetum coccineum]
GKTVGYDQITTKDTIILYCSANGVKIDFAKLIWGELVSKLPIVSFNNWTLKKTLSEGPPFTPHMLDICTTDGHEEFQAPTSTLQTGESVPEGTKHGVKRGQRKSIHRQSKHSSSKMEAPIFGPLSKEAYESPKGHYKKRNKSTTTRIRTQTSL